MEYNESLKLLRKVGFRYILNWVIVAAIISLVILSYFKVGQSLLQFEFVTALTLAGMMLIFILRLFYNYLWNLDNEESQVMNIPEVIRIIIRNRSLWARIAMASRNEWLNPKTKSYGKSSLAVKGFKEIYAILASLAISNGLLAFYHLINRGLASIPIEIFQKDYVGSFLIFSFLVTSIPLLMRGYILFYVVLNQRTGNSLVLLYFLISVAQAAFLFFAGESIFTEIDDVVQINLGFIYSIFWLSLCLFITTLWTVISRGIDHKIPYEIIALNLCVSIYLLIVSTISPTLLLSEEYKAFTTGIILFVLILRTVLDFIIYREGYFPKEVENHPQNSDD